MLFKSDTYTGLYIKNIHYLPPSPPPEMLPQFINTTPIDNRSAPSSPRFLKTFRLSTVFLICLSSICIISILFPVAFLYLMPYSLNDFLINQQFIPAQDFPLHNTHFSDLGREEMLRSSVTIVGVAKNVADGLPNILPRVELLMNKFQYAQAVFVEGDSTDNTYTMLKSWADIDPSNRQVYSYNVKHLTESTGLSTFDGTPLPREGRISATRNYALSKITKPTKYMIVIDLDIIGWNQYGVEDSFGRPSWDVMCSNGVILYGIYRDTYAFRAKNIDTNHHKAGMDYSLYNYTKSEQLENRRLYKASKSKAQNLMTTYDTQPVSVSKPIEVDSCFGGIAIYRNAMIQNCQYHYRQTKAPHVVDCEHVLFHQCMKDINKARVFSNPNMKLWYGHTDFSQIQTYMYKQMINTYKQLFV